MEGDVALFVIQQHILPTLVLKGVITTIATVTPTPTMETPTIGIPIMEIPIMEILTIIPIAINGPTYHWGILPI
jgi:hypothetical protein